MDKKKLLSRQGFVYDPVRSLWRNGVVQKAISEEAVDDHTAQQISAWIHRLLPESRRWDVMLSRSSSTAHAEQLAAELGWK